MDDLLTSKLFGFTLWKCMLLGIVTAVDKFVVQRCDTIVQGVRQLQAILNIAPCLSVISDTAPGVTENHCDLEPSWLPFAG
ncbi:hypothetical protein F5B21DRAFT_457021 [Xylaria acuta]|nr:hypothetical protein F5B21DRAFT_457021 [Xylaria acuta]